MKSSVLLQDALYAGITLLVLALCFDSLAFSCDAASTAGTAATDPKPALRGARFPGDGAGTGDAAAMDRVDAEAADEVAGPAAATIEQFFSARTTAFSVTDSDEPHETAAPTTTASTAAPARTAQVRPVSPFGSFAHVIGPSTERTLAMVRLTSAANEFAFKLAKALVRSSKSSPQRNIFFSPLTLFRFVQH